MNIENKFNIGDRVYVRGWGGGYGVVRRILPEIGRWSTEVLYQVLLANDTYVERNESCLVLQSDMAVPHVSPHYFQD